MVLKRQFHDQTLRDNTLNNILDAANKYLHYLRSIQHIKNGLIGHQLAPPHV